MQVHKNAEQTEKLVTCLVGSSKNHCFLHVDKKNDVLYRELSIRFCDHSQITVCRKRVKVNWSGFSQVEATLSLMREVYDSEIGFERIHFMSGEDFPMKSLDDIYRFLKDHRDNEFMEYDSIGTYGWRILRYNYLTEHPQNRSLLIRVLQKLSREIQRISLPKREGLEKFNLYKGSSWFNLSIEAMEYIVKFVNENPEFVKRFQYTSCADEHFFHIIVLNSVFKDKVINNNLYYTEWDEGKSSPKYLSDVAIVSAKKIPNKLFLRKVDTKMANILFKDCV